jgi:hypothetical protein
MKFHKNAKWIMVLLAIFGMLEAGILDRADSDFSVQRVSRNQVVDFPVSGHIKAAYRYRDALGTNYIIYTYKKGRIHGMEHRDKMYLYHFVVNGKGPILKRRIYDTIQCGEDESIGLGIFDGALTVTDRDHDGIGEITFLYGINCLNDMTAMDMKLMLLENGRKYAIRGAVPSSFEGKVYGAKYAHRKVDSSFYSAPRSLLNYAKRRWNRFGIYSADNL